MSSVSREKSLEVAKDVYLKYTYNFNDLVFKAYITPELENVPLDLCIFYGGYELGRLAPARIYPCWFRMTPDTVIGVYFNNKLVGQISADDNWIDPNPKPELEEFIAS